MQQFLLHYDSAKKQDLFSFSSIEKRFIFVKNNFFKLKKIHFQNKKQGYEKFFLLKKFVFQKKEYKRLFFMTISSPEREAKKVKIAVDRNPVETSFERWACDLKKG